MARIIIVIIAIQRLLISFHSNSIFINGDEKCHAVAQRLKIGSSCSRIARNLVLIALLPSSHNLFTRTTTNTTGVKQYQFK